MVKGSDFWKNITKAILVLFVVPIVAYGANILMENKEKIAILETKQGYSDKEFDRINAKLDTLIERVK